MTESNLIHAAEHDFKIYRGDTAQTRLTFTTDGAVPIDLSGASILMQIKKRTTDITSVAEFKTSDSTLVISGVDNNIVDIISWETVPKGDWVYDFQVTYPSGTIATYLRGKVISTNDTSRP